VHFFQRALAARVRAIAEEAIMTMAIEQDQNVEKSQNARLIVLSTVFIGSLGAATLCSMMGYAAWAMGFGLIGICSMAIFIVKLKTSQ